MGLSNAEKETMITFSQQDLKEGFINFSTSYRPHYEKIAKRCAGYIISERTINGPDGKPWEWILKIDEKCLSRTGFSLGKPRTRAVSAEERERLVSRLKNRGKNE